jgi:hypothetical protein
MSEALVEPVRASKQEVGIDDRERILEQRFDDAMIGVYGDAKSQANYVATRFLQLVRRRGGLEAARTLLAQPGVSKGFLKLRAAGRLHLSMEYVVLEKWFAPLFTDEERRTARKRLLDHGMSEDQLP